MRAISSGLLKARTAFAKLGRGHAELGAEGRAEMTVAGITEVERQIGYVLAIAQQVERAGEPKAALIAVERDALAALE